MKKNTRVIIFLTSTLLLLGLLIGLASTASKNQTVSLSEVISEVNQDKVSGIEVEGNKLTVTLKDTSAQKQVTYKEDSANLKDYGIDYSKVNVTTKSADNGSGRIFEIILTLLPIIVIIGFFYFMMRQAQGSSNQAMSFGKSKARLFAIDKQKVTFADVAGSEEAKQELVEIVEFLKYPGKFESLGAKIPKGVLLFGPPGTGKTLLARAVAGEAGVPFFNISGSEFVEMFVGVGASRVRDLFLKARKNAPCIIFIDEIDAVGRQRGSGMGGGHDEREQTLNQILVEMDGFEKGTNVIVMAATNRPDVLDPALLRPGRFDRRVTLDMPDRKDRLQILKVHTKNKPLADGIDMDELAAKTPGFSGADLANLANEAAILAARQNQKKVTSKDLHNAVEKVVLGPERRSHILSDKEKAITAAHEAGHALVGHVLPNTNPVHKITIVSRGGAGGVTWSLPTEDKHLYTAADFKDDLAMALGGRIAEKVVYGEENITNGAENDLRQATNLARRMVMEYGMSDKLKNLVFGVSGRSLFLGRDLSEMREYSEDVAKLIDDEVATLINQAAEKAEAVIASHRTMLDKITAKLIEVETIEGEGLDKLFAEIEKGQGIDKQASPKTRTTKATSKPAAA